MTRFGWTTLVTLVCASSLDAQAVGALPERSPYADARGGQRLGVDVGYLAAGADPAGVAPKSAAIGALRYEVHAAGPVYFFGRLFGVSTERSVLDYTKKAAARRVGSSSSFLLGADLGGELALTGDRTWHQLQPLIHTSIGMVSGLGEKRDVSLYSFGTRLLFSYGLATRWVTGANSEVRVDLTWLAWPLKYPDTFRSTEGDSVAIRATGSLTPWVKNHALTVSYAWGIFR